MQPDGARRADTLAWLRKAEGDLRAAAVDLDADPPLVEDALFHCQQAVEKVLKALLTWHDVPFRKTHSLEELGRQVVALHGELRNLADRASLLSEYAQKFRYPGEVDSPSLAEATDALALAREAHAAVVGALGERLFQYELVGVEGDGHQQLVERLWVGGALGTAAWVCGGRRAMPRASATSGGA